MGIDRRNASGLSALQLAIQQGHVDSVDYLIASGADLSLLMPARDSQGVDMHALALAAYQGNFIVFTHVLNAFTTQGLALISPQGTPTLVDFAFKGGNLDIVRSLVQHGINVSQPPARIGKLTLTACFAGNKTDHIDLLLHYNPALIDALGSNGLSPLHQAALSGKLNQVIDILRRGANSQVLTSAENVYKTQFNAYDLALLSDFACLAETIGGPGYLNQTELNVLRLYDAISKRKGEDKVAALLIQQPELIEIPFQGLTPLQWAVTSGVCAIVGHLLNAGAGINRGLGLGADVATPLDTAFNLGHAHLIELLMTQGARANRCHQTIGHQSIQQLLAEPRHHGAIHGLLAQNETLLHQADWDGITPLHLAIFYGYHDLAEAWFDLGADAHVKAHAVIKNPAFSALAAQSAYEIALKGPRTRHDRHLIRKMRGSLAREVVVSDVSTTAGEIGCPPLDQTHVWLKHTAASGQDQVLWFLLHGKPLQNRQALIEQLALNTIASSFGHAPIAQWLTQHPDQENSSLGTLSSRGAPTEPHSRALRSHQALAEGAPILQFADMPNSGMKRKR